MTTTQMVAALDAELARLRQVRELLSGAAKSSSDVITPRQKASNAAAEDGGKPKRVLSPEARERIAAAQRARWAAAKSTSKPGRTSKAATKRGGGSETAAGGTESTA